MFRIAPGFARWVAVVTFTLLLAGPAAAQRDWLGTTKNRLRKVNAQIAGQVVDFTRNHGCDRRIYCPSLNELRDVYVYLPPGYDGRTPFPGMLWLHGIGQDEKPFLDLIPIFDDAVRTGRLPPMVVAVPDGSVRGQAAFFNTGSFYLNGIRGNFEDYVVHDVWDFVNQHFVIRPERNARVIGGASMGGFGAFNIGFKHKELFGHLVGIMPPLNLRYGDCHGRYRADYDPNCFQLRTTNRRYELVAVFYCVIPIRSRRLTDPVVGRRYPDRTGFIAANNPYEMLWTYDVKPDDFGMFIGYGKRDEFNIDAQVESFLDAAASRGIRPAVVVIPDGRHNSETALRFLPDLGRWLWQQVGAYVPPAHALPLPTVPCLPRCARRAPVAVQQSLTFIPPDTTSR